MRKLYLHIGTEKTGTSTLQKLLQINRERLAERGVAYLQSPGLTSQWKLLTYCLDDTFIDDHVQRLGLFEPEKRHAWKAQFLEEFLAELDSLEKNIHSVIISSEHLHSRLLSEQNIATLFSLVSPHFSEQSVIVYLRRQDRVARSLYSTVIRNGGSWSKEIPSVDPDMPYFNYWNSLSLWSRVFGNESIIPRVFQREKLHSGDLITDFLHLCGLGEHI